MPKGLKGWVHSFSTGKHPGEGELAKHTFTKDDLDQIVLNLSASNPVPHTITHKKMYSPFAYAHGVEAKREGDALYLRSEKINPDFEALITSGALYERSVGIVKDAIKGFMLDHVAWLGAEPPAVQGLAPVEYAKDDAYTLFSSSCAVDNKGEFSFVDTQTPRSLKKIARSIQLFLVDKFDLATANTVIPEYYIEDVEWAEERARKAQEDEYTKNKQDHSIFTKAKGADPVPDEITQEQLNQAKKDAAAEATVTANANFKKQQDEQKADFEAKRIQDEWGVICKEMIADGVPPAKLEGVAEFAASLSRSTASVTFSRKGAKGEKDEEIVTPDLKWFGEFVKGALKPTVAMAKHMKVSGDEGQEIDLEDSQAIANKAVAYQKDQASKGNEISFTQAVGDVTAEAST